jgi:hypothetical protein
MGMTARLRLLIAAFLKAEEMRWRTAIKPANVSSE